MIKLKHFTKLINQNRTNKIWFFPKLQIDLRQKRVGVQKEEHML